MNDFNFIQRTQTPRFGSSSSKGSFELPSFGFDRELEEGPATTESGHSISAQRSSGSDSLKRNAIEENLDRFFLNENDNHEFLLLLSITVQHNASSDPAAVKILLESSKTPSKLVFNAWIRL